jgi:hypothetical protein
LKFTLAILLYAESTLMSKIFATLPRNNICVGKAAQERKMTGNSCFRSNPDQTANKKGERS